MIGGAGNDIPIGWIRVVTQLAKQVGLALTSVNSKINYILLGTDLENLTNFIDASTTTTLSTSLVQTGKVGARQPYAGER